MATLAPEPVVKHSVHTLVFRSLKRSHDMFIHHEGLPVPEDELALKRKIACKTGDEHALVKSMPPPNETIAKIAAKNISGKPDPTQPVVIGGHAYPNAPGVTLSVGTTAVPQPLSEQGIHQVVENMAAQDKSVPSGVGLGDIYQHARGGETHSQALVLSKGTQQLVPRKALHSVRPQWHPPWKLMRVISGHLGWVRCIAVDPSNEWFATGSGDRTIKVSFETMGCCLC